MRKFEYSLGNYIEDAYGKDFISLIWSEKNEKSPYEVAPKSSKKAWFKCPAGIHDDEERYIYNATERGFNCKKCSVIEQHEEQKKSLIGQKFGKLFVKEYYLGSKNNHLTYYLCDCDCGNKDIKVFRGNLLRGSSLSCGCLRHENSGENHYNWKGGITPEVMKIRNSKSYKEWRTAVFERDDYTCQCCGQRGGKLTAHHIYSFSSNEDRRLDINNGITLCENCHSISNIGSLHNIYGATDVTSKQLEEYINSKRQELGVADVFSIQDFLIYTQTA